METTTTIIGEINTDLIILFVGLLVGSLVTFLAARMYYEKAGHDLANEAKKLERLNVLMLRGLESSGLAEFSRDDDGSIKGMVVTGSGTAMAAIATMTADATVIRKEDKEK